MSVALCFWVVFLFCFVKYRDFLFRNVTELIPSFKSYSPALFSPFKTIAIYAGIGET